MTVLEHKRSALDLLREHPGRLVWTRSGGSPSFLVFHDEIGFLLWVDFRPSGWVVVHELGENEWRTATASGISIHTGRFLDVGCTPLHFQLVAAGYPDAVPPKTDGLEAWGVPA